MKYTYKFIEVQKELNKQGLKMLVYQHNNKNHLFVAKNEVILSRHILLGSIIDRYGLDKNICIEIS